MDKSKLPNWVKLHKRLLSLKTDKFHAFRMESWLQANPKADSRNTVKNGDTIPVKKLRENGPECQTAGCLAGECFIIGAPLRKYRSIEIGQNSYQADGASVRLFASGFLGLTDSEAGYVFYGLWAAPGKSVHTITLNDAIEYVQAVIDRKGKVYA